MGSGSFLYGSEVHEFKGLAYATFTPELHAVPCLMMGICEV
jgi:hypothetical protein